MRDRCGEQRFLRWRRGHGCRVRRESVQPRRLHGSRCNIYDMCRRARGGLSLLGCTGLTPNTAAPPSARVRSSERRASLCLVLAIDSTSSHSTGVFLCVTSGLIARGSHLSRHIRRIRPENGRLRRQRRPAARRQGRQERGPHVQHLLCARHPHFMKTKTCVQLPSPVLVASVC